MFLFCLPGNLALGKKTHQSRSQHLKPSDDPTEWITLSASLAVDGDTNTDVTQPPYCAAAEHPTILFTWWAVNLGQKSTINSVVIYTGDDCCKYLQFESLHNTKKWYY